MRPLSTPLTAPRDPGLHEHVIDRAGLVIELCKRTAGSGPGGAGADRPACGGRAGANGLCGHLERASLEGVEWHSVPEGEGVCCRCPSVEPRLHSGRYPSGQWP